MKFARSASAPVSCQQYQYYGILYQVKPRMFRRSRVKNDPDLYLRQVDDTYIFDSGSGLYRPKAHTKAIGRDWVATIVSITTLFVVGLYTHYARLQWCEMQKATVAAQNSVVNADMNFKRGERAWIVFDTDYSDKMQLTRSDKISVPIQLENIGKTPAKNIHGFLVVDELKPAEVPIFDYISGRVSTPIRVGILYPGAPQTTKAQELTEQRKPVAATPEKHRQFKQGAIIFTVWGKLWYDDIFRIQHWVTFCHAISEVPAGHSKECTDQNSVDEEQLLPMRKKERICERSWLPWGHSYSEQSQF
jgi:hypothetical protein